MTSSRQSLEFYGGVQGSLDNRQDSSEKESHSFAVVGQLTKMMADQQEAFNNFLKETAKMEKVIQDKITKIQEEVTSLRQDVASMKETQDEKSNGKRLYKRKPDAKLTGDVKRLHHESENQFDGSKLYADSHNQIVADFLISQLQEKYDGQESDIKKAVHCYYESCCRLYVDPQPERLHVKEENDKLRSRQRQASLLQHKVTALVSISRPQTLLSFFGIKNKLYDRRLKHCKTNKEMKYWKQLDEQYMTEESDDDEGAFRTHKPMWRSQKLNRFIPMFDKRERRKNIFKKSRKESYMSNNSVPANAPTWAVASSSQDSSTPTNTDIDTTPATSTKRSPMSTESDGDMTPPVNSRSRQARTTKQTMSADVPATPSTKPKDKAPVCRLSLFDFEDWDSDSEMVLSDSN